MLLPRQKIIPRPVSRSKFLPAPVGGWNARDSLGGMDELDAVKLTNWFPKTTNVVMRYGHTRYSTGLPSQVESLMAFQGASTNKLLAASGTAIYDVTAGGAVGAAVQSGLTNARWQHINYSNTSGNYIYMVNGADAPRYWDGTTWTNAAITGVTVANLIHINEHKSRVWFVEKDSLNAWYLAVDAIAGAATKFPLNGIAQHGGYLMAMATWTIDAGYGVDDLAVFICSGGDVIVYRGTDPSDSTKWALVGVFYIGSPVGRRCFMKWAGDLLIICQDGVMPLSGALQSSRVQPRVAITDKIQSAMSSAITLYDANYGWQLMSYPRENMLLLNVPVQEGGSQQQYVMNTISKAWCNFTGWNANCWELYNDDLYFGGNQFVGKAWNGLDDNGTAITADGLQAFNYFGDTARKKRFTMMQPSLQTNGTPSILAAINTDFSLADPTAALSFSPTSYAVWDTSLWDSGVWGSDLVISDAWQGATGLGYCGAPRLKSQASGIQVQWNNTNVLYEVGAFI